eukprot:scaffold12941_cov120-Isochrysis_galbana.AAC.1
MRTVETVGRLNVAPTHACSATALTNGNGRAILRLDFRTKGLVSLVQAKVRLSGMKARTPGPLRLAMAAA